QELQGQKVQGLLYAGLIAARTAQALDPARTEARLELGWLHRQWAQSLRRHSENPREQLEQALGVIEALAREEQKDPELHRLLGLVYKAYADHEDAAGGEPLSWLDKAIESQRRVIQLDGNQMSTRIELANAYLMRAAYARAPEPDKDLERARQVLEEARALNPRYVLLYFFEARAHRLRALRHRARGEATRPSWEASIELNRQGSAINEQLPYFHYNVGLNLLELAQEEWDQGGKALPWLEKAEAPLTRAIEVAPDNAYCHLNLGWMHVKRAEYLRAAGDNPEASVRAAEKALQRANERGNAGFLPWENLGRAHYTQAAFVLENKGDPRPFLARASEALSQALAKNPKAVESTLFRAKVRALQARWKARQKARVEDVAKDFDEAGRLFREALRLEPANQDSRLAFGHFLREWTSWKKEHGQESGPLLREGLSLAEALLMERQDVWPEAHVLRASLRLLQAEGAAPAEQRRLWQQAREELTRALKDNPNLGPAWNELLSRARPPLDGP
ncbi:MAG TPA: hypothetical protein VEY88_24480, partial [Archangium sp.]|nr:hypothetical protein [Archangium sp.]